MSGVGLVARREIVTRIRERGFLVSFVIMATILVAIIALAADRVDSPEFVTAFTFFTVAYILSRGIAKASRVLEQ